MSRHDRSILVATVGLVLIGLVGAVGLVAVDALGGHVSAGLAGVTGAAVGALANYLATLVVRVNGRDVAVPAGGEERAVLQ